MHLSTRRTGAGPGRWRCARRPSRGQFDFVLTSFFLSGATSGWPVLVCGPPAPPSAGKYPLRTLPLSCKVFGRLVFYTATENFIVRAFELTELLLSEHRPIHTLHHPPRVG